ncbi:MAG: hypothetical protein M5U28_46550 [Sandaracinaceae bacterium]|nr:hypothetical protein [Sandaracinaceae bacterium]
MVVAVVLDQLATHTRSSASLCHLTTRTRAIRRSVREGAFHRQVVYAYPGTCTAAGAVIRTGAPPASAASSRRRMDRARGREVPVADDATQRCSAWRAPSSARRRCGYETVGDVLERASEGAPSRSLSVKDRGRRLRAGRAPPRPRALL